MLLHETVRSSLRERIVSGTLAVGTPLPSTAELCVEFGASRGPVRQALAALAAEGLIATGQGRVPTVARAPLAQDIDDFFSFSAWVTSLGRTLTDARWGGSAIGCALPAVRRRKPDSMSAGQP